MSVAPHRKLLNRMMASLLPAAAVPLFVFGYVALSSHYESLRSRNVSHHDTMATLLANQLDGDVHLALTQLTLAADDDVYKAGNLFQIRAAMASWRAYNPAVARVSYVDTKGIVVATEPHSSDREGKELRDMELTDFRADGFRAGPFYQDFAGVPRFLMARQVRGLDENVAAHVVIELVFEGWLQTARAMLRNQPEILVAIIPDNKDGAVVKVSEQPREEFWPRVSDLRNAGATVVEPVVAGERHYSAQRKIELARMVMVVAQPFSIIYAAPRRVLVGYLGGIVALLAAMGGLLYAIARSITVRVGEIAAAASKLSEGHLDSRSPVNGNDELTLLAETFNRMGESLHGSHLRMRVMYKSVMELFSCNSIDDLMRRAVELVCTQCDGEVAWFLPSKPGRRVDYAESDVYIGLHGWAWKGHRVIEVAARDAGGLWRRSDGDRVFQFNIKLPSQPGQSGREIGVLRVAYGRNPDEFTESLLHALVSLVETAVAKQEHLRAGAAVTTELAMAEAVQRNVMTDNMVVSDRSRVAWHYRPASRLGGDWFYIVEDTARGKLYAIIGDVTGHGLPQGLVTTAVKGALDIIDMLVKKYGNEFVTGPASIVSLLETVVARVAAPNMLAMTCLVCEIDFAGSKLRICNAGHTFPILLREEEGVNVARHLHKNQQPMLGRVGEAARDPHSFTEAVYDLEPHDLLVIYTDGLTDAKNLKPGIFGRFMLRGLRKRRDYRAPDELRDEILDMFNYYTQGARIQDDVCFVVVQMPPSTGEGRSTRRPA